MCKEKYNETESYVMYDILGTPIGYFIPLEKFGDEFYGKLRKLCGADEDANTWLEWRETE